MVVICIAHSEQVEDVAVRLAAVHSDGVYQERVAADETLFSIRAQNLNEARYLSGLLYRAGAEQIGIDAEAA